MNEHQSEYDHAVKNTDSMLTASIICSLVSAFLGALVFSVAAIVLACVGIAYVKKIQAMDGRGSDEVIRLKAVSLKRKLIVAFVISIIAFVLNIAILVTLLPVVLEELEAEGLYSGYDSLFGSTGAITPDVNSTWG